MTDAPTFTRHWFRRRLWPPFREHVAPRFAGQPCCYVEIGVWEGMCLHWMLTNVLTHPASRARGIDPWAAMPPKHDKAKMDAICDRAASNLEGWLKTQQLRLYRATSTYILPRLAATHTGEVDLILIDGDHNAPAVVTDAAWATKLLRPGGWVVFDDVVNDSPKQQHVAQGIEIWLRGKPPVKEAWRSKFAACFEKVA